MDRSPGFGSTPRYLFALFRLAFASAPPLSGLTLQRMVTRRLIMQKARRQAFLEPGGSRLPSDRLQAYSFRYYFTLLAGVLFTFPSRY